MIAHSKSILLSFALLLCIHPLALWSANDSLTWIEWLSPGLQTAQAPAFSSEVNLSNKAFRANDLFSGIAPHREVWPYEGMKQSSFNGKEKSWEVKRANRNGYVEIGPVSDLPAYKIGEAASYLYTPTFIQIRIVIKSMANLELHHNGNLAASAEIKAGKETRIEKTFDLEPGKHLFHLNAILDREDSGPWSFTAFIPNDSLPEGFYLGSEDRRRMDLDLLMHGERIGSIRPSFDGKYLLLSHQRTDPPKGAREVWYEIRERESGNCVQQLRGMKVNHLQWDPTGHRLAFIRPGKDKGEIWLMTIPGGRQEKIAEIDKLSSFRWCPKGKSMICSIREKATEESSGLKRYLNMSDRQANWRHRSFLLQLELASGESRRLTWGHLSTYLQDIRPDGKEILFSSSKPDFSAQPYSLNSLYRLNLETMELDSIWTKRHHFNISYSPDGKQWLVSGGPALFEELGTHLPKGRIPNHYDTQLYLFKPEDKEVQAITRYFDPKVESSRWNSLDGKIYLLAQEGTYRYLYSYDSVKSTFEKLTVEPDVVSQWDLSADGNWLAYTGTSIARPEQAYLMDVSTMSAHLIAEPEAQRFEKVVFGKHADWHYQHKGTQIEGRIYFPPDFDPEKKYPVIVYYYGGTNPTNRAFRGRYPKNLFAAMGYIVYVIQPSGATGYGQEFSSRHVNNWGKTVADEIIGATKAFLKAHPFADAKKVGCIGASYGGFMTMLLTTRTDLFAAAISHAGISSISSYWGEGLWGYAYSATATADRFPWNDPDIYIGQSPLFKADKINTPLLLLHGEKDTNVPAGESIQLFTALKLLGKPVEYIEVEGQDHHILDYEKRIQWQKTILAWFDYWLKDEKAWWDALYPEKAL